jgi:apolipoprotein N-acyltransferase
LSDASRFRAWLAAGAAVALSASAYALYARAAWPWVALGWIGLVPWLGVLDRVRSLRAALAAGLAMAVAFELAVFGWFSLAIADYTGGSAVLPLVGLGMAAPILQLQFVTVAVLRTYVRASRGGTAATVLVTAAAYVATESFAPKLFGDTLGYPLYGSVWLRQGADVAGVPGLTFLIVAVNECVRAVLRAHEARPARAAWTRQALLPAVSGLALVSALAAYGAWRCAQLAASSDGAALTVGIVQADLGHYDRMAAEIGRFETVRRILDDYVELSAPALAREDLALLLWPETVYPTTFGKPKSEDGAAFDREIVDFVAHARVPLIFGSYDTDGSEEFNAAFFLAPDGGAQPFGIYRKTRLFPLTERVPAFLDGAWIRRALPWLGTWSPGSGARVVPVALRDGTSIHVAPLICYDVLDPELARESVRHGADLIVTLSNDSWFAFGPGAELHLVGAAFRSIETRRPQVRSTNTGISAVIDATGTVTATAGVDERTTLIATVVPERRVATLVVRLGEWLNPCAALATVAIAVWARRRRDGTDLATFPSGPGPGRCRTGASSHP